MSTLRVNIPGVTPGLTTLEVPEESIDNDNYDSDTTQGTEDSVVNVDFIPPRDTVTYYFCCCKIFKKTT